MKTVSAWAKRNVNAARLTIVLSHVVLLVLAMRLGLVLLRSGIRLPGIAAAVPLVMLSVSFLLLRAGKLKLKRSTQYMLQRTSFFLVGASIFLTTVFFVNNEKLLNGNLYSPLYGRETGWLVKPAAFPASRFSKAQLKKMVRLLKKPTKKEQLTGLSVAAIIVFTVFLVVLISILSCTIACNGSGVLAFLLFTLGSGGLIFLCVMLCRRLLKNIPPPEGREGTMPTDPHFLPPPFPFRRRNRKKPEPAGTVSE